jgi:hypothetical protein
MKDIKFLNALLEIMNETNVSSFDVEFIEIRNRIEKLCFLSKKGTSLDFVTIYEVIEDLKLVLELLDGSNESELQKFKRRFQELEKSQ